MFGSVKRVSFLWRIVNYSGMKFSNISTCSHFHKHFTLVTYGCGKISLIIHCMYAAMQCFQNLAAHFVIAVSYECKMFMKLAHIS